MLVMRVGVKVKCSRFKLGHWLPPHKTPSYFISKSQTMPHTIQTATQKIRSKKEEFMKDGIDLGKTESAVLDAGYDDRRQAH